MKTGKRISSKLTAILLAGVLTVTSAPLPVLASESTGAGQAKTAVNTALTSDTIEDISDSGLSEKTKSTAFSADSTSLENSDSSDLSETSDNTVVSDNSEDEYYTETAKDSEDTENPDFSVNVENVEGTDYAGAAAPAADTENLDSAENTADQENTGSLEDTSGGDSAGTAENTAESGISADGDPAGTTGDNSEQTEGTTEFNSEQTEGSAEGADTSSDSGQTEAATQNNSGQTEGTTEFNSEQTEGSAEGAGTSSDSEQTEAAAEGNSGETENAADSGDDALITEPGSEESTSEDSSAGILTGLLGANLTWSLDLYGTLTVSGTGDMCDVSFSDSLLQGSLSSSLLDFLAIIGMIRKIVIEEGVTSIGDGAFKSCPLLTDVSLPEGLLSIGENAFSGCNSLTSLELPDTLTNIEDQAFAGSGITEITIPKGVTSIGSEAFGSCTDLKTLDFGTNCPSSISSDAFSSITATVYYNNFLNNWSSDKRSSYGGSITWTEKAISLFKCECRLTTDTLTYNGTAQEPEFTLTYDDTSLNSGVHYTVSYASNTNVGNATMTLTGKGSFSGTLQRTFTIKQADQPVKLSLSKNPVSVGQGSILTVEGAKGTTTFRSTDTSVVEIDSTGKITTNGVGVAMLLVSSTATANYKEFKGSPLNPASQTIIVVTPGRTSLITAKSQSKGFKVSWGYVKGATGYLLYRNGTKIATIDSGYTLSYTDTAGNTNGTKYTYKIVATSAYGNSTLSRSTSTYKVASPKILIGSNTSYRQMTVRWEKNAKATGYQLQYSKTSGFSSGVKTTTFTSASTVSKVFSSLTKGQTYYLRIRAYKTVGSKKYYSLWSSKKVVKISAYTVPARETNVTSASSGNVLIKVRGIFYTSATSTILNKLNAIRYEACKEGIKDPVTGNKLTLDDYTPLKWSSDLEWIAQTRAVEATLVRDHTRPNGKSCSSCTYNGTTSWSESLAWNYSGISKAISHWYLEKSSWKKGTTKGTGHYQMIINPNLVSVGVGCFRPSPTDHYTVTAEFSIYSNLNAGRTNITGAYEQYVEVLKSKSSSYSYYKNVKIPVSAASVTGITSKKYTGKSITQKPVLKIGTTTLVYGTDYTLSYSNNKKVGKATVIIKGKGRYTGTVKKTFKIVK